MLPLTQIDKTWSLFLDRDGVINHEKQNDYIHTWDEFRFYEGVLHAIKIFTEKFNKIIVVTNQKGVGKGLTKESDLHLIHQNMQTVIEKNSGKIDAIYYCPDVDTKSPNRKPNAGMGLQAIQYFPEIIPAKSIMVGNTISDMQFGRNLGTYNVFLPTTRLDVALDDSRIDAVYPSLFAFAQALL